MKTIKESKTHWGWGYSHLAGRRGDGKRRQAFIIRAGTAPERRERKSAMVHTLQPLLSEKRLEPRCGQTGHRWRGATATISSGWVGN